MKNITLKFMAFGAAAMMFASCDLNLFPEGSIVYDETSPAFLTQDDVDSFGVGVYTYFRAIQGGGQYVAEEVMFDGFNAAIDYGNNYGSIHRLDNDFTSSNEYVESVWGNNYIAISKFNTVIVEADKCDIPEIKDAALAIQGDAYFARAFAYLTLARHFAPAYDPATADKDLCVPLVLKYNQTEKPSRATNQTVYAQIKSDLDSAMVRLTKYGPTPAAATDKITVDAVKALYARYYLDVQDYENAAKYASELVDSDVYKLAADESEFRAIWEDDTNIEAIIQLFASQAEAPASISAFTGYRANTSATKGYAFNPYYIPTKTMISRYEVTDLRYKTWFDTTSSEQYSSGSNLYNGVTVFIKWWGSKKYTSSDLRTSLAAAPLRISEMYLIAAEAYAQDGDAAKAKQYLSALQSKRGAKVNLNATLDKIQDEWYRETVAEGLTLSCHKRWGLGYEKREPQDIALSNSLIMEGENFELKSLADDDYHMVWPIPRYERQVNPNLEQNIGYGE